MLYHWVLRPSLTTEISKRMDHKVAYMMTWLTSQNQITTVAGHFLHSPKYHSEVSVQKVYSHDNRNIWRCKLDKHEYFLFVRLITLSEKLDKIDWCMSKLQNESLLHSQCQFFKHLCIFLKSLQNAFMEKIFTKVKISSKHVPNISPSVLELTLFRMLISRQWSLQIREMNRLTSKASNSRLISRFNSRRRSSPWRIFGRLFKAYSFWGMSSSGIPENILSQSQMRNLRKRLPREARLYLI